MSSNEKKVVEKIRSQYTEHEVTKAEQLKSLDKKVKRGAKVFSYIYGSVSSLVLGTGMCLAMGVIGTGTPLMIAGIAIGVCGIGLVASTYPIYKKILEKSKKKHANEIIALSDEILNNN